MNSTIETEKVGTTVETTNEEVIKMEKVEIDRDKEYKVPLSISTLKKFNNFDEAGLIEMVSRGNYNEFSHGIRIYAKFIGSEEKNLKVKVGYITSYDPDSKVFTVKANSTLIKYMSKHDPNFMDNAIIEPKVIFDKTIVPFRVKMILSFFIYPKVLPKPGKKKMLKTEAK